MPFVRIAAAALIALSLPVEAEEEKRRCTAVVTSVTPFSTGVVGDAPPPAWQPLRITPFKTPTDYTTQYEDGRTVVRAQAHASASGLMHRVREDTRASIRLRWEWKIDDAPPSADVRSARAEDAAARVVLEFSRTPDLARAEAGASTRLLMGADPKEHVLLMYIWSERVPVGSILTGPRSAHVRMIVVGGPEGFGRWQRFERDPVADLRRAFGMQLGWLTGVAILTDTDNTGERADARYGDIVLTRCAEEDDGRGPL